MLDDTSRNKMRVKVTFYWPWARLGAAIKSRTSTTNSGNRGKKHDFKGKGNAQRDEGGTPMGKGRTGAWVKDEMKPKGNASKGKDNTAQTGSSRDSRLKKLFRRSTQRHTSAHYLQPETDGKESWYKRRRISITQHMEKMKESMRKQSNKVTEFKGINDILLDYEDDSISQTSTSPSSTCPWWVEKWWNLYESRDPVVEKTSEELADMSTLARRLRSLRLQHGLAEEWMQGELDISDVISDEDINYETSGVQEENPWLVISSFFRDPTLSMTQSPYSRNEKDSNSMINTMRDVILPGMSMQ